MKEAMRAGLLILMVAAAWCWIGCEPQEDLIDPGEGEVMFWMDDDYGEGYIDVWVGGDNKGRVTHYYPDDVPACGAGGCVSAFIDEGTYEYRAESESGELNWNGRFTIEEGECLPILLERDGNNPAATGGTNALPGVPLPLER